MKSCLKRPSGLLYSFKRKSTNGSFHISVSSDSHNEYWWFATIIKKQYRWSVGGFIKERGTTPLDPQSFITSEMREKKNFRGREIFKTLFWTKDFMGFFRFIRFCSVFHYMQHDHLNVSINLHNATKDLLLETLCSAVEI